MSLVPGHRFLAAGFWSLVTGSYTGYALRVTGRELLIAGKSLAVNYKGGRGLLQVNIGMRFKVQGIRSWAEDGGFWICLFFATQPATRNAQQRPETSDQYPASIVCLENLHCLLGGLLFSGLFIFSGSLGFYIEYL